MMYKTELQNENRLLREQTELLKGMTEKYTVDHCPDCGNPVLLNRNQFQRRLDKDRKFYCAAGHQFSYKT